MYKYIASLHASVAMLLVTNFTLSNSMTPTNTVIMLGSVRTATSMSTVLLHLLYYCIECVIKRKRDPLLLH